jgi:hypothetical protein
MDFLIIAIVFSLKLAESTPPKVLLKRPILQVWVDPFDNKRPLGYAKVLVEVWTVGPSNHFVVSLLV